MEHPVGGAFANSEEDLLKKVKVLEKAIQDLSAELEFQESAVDFFRQEAMEKNAENWHLKKTIKHMSENEMNAKRKPGPKGRRPGHYGVHEDRDGGADDDAQK